MENADRFMENADRFTENAGRFMENAGRFMENADRFMENASRFMENASRFMENASRFVAYADTLSLRSPDMIRHEVTFSSISRRPSRALRPFREVTAVRLPLLSPTPDRRFASERGLE